MNTVFIIWTTSMLIEFALLIPRFSGRLPHIASWLKWYFTVDAGVRVAYFCIRYDANNSLWIALTYAYVVCYLAWLALISWPLKRSTATEKAKAVAA